MEVQIANPIYDVVFKYLMEDNAIAKLVISSIIGEEIIELEPKPQERTREKVKIDKERRRNELEQLLAVFDQSNITADWHILNVKEEDFPEKYRPVIRRLKSAASNPSVKRQMKAEDEFIRYLQDCIRVERDKALEESKKSLAEKDKSLAEKDKENEKLKNEVAELKRQLGKK